eukprot:2542811-Prymnesium_polylepis.1
MCVGGSRAACGKSGCGPCVTTHSAALGTVLRRGVPDSSRGEREEVAATRDAQPIFGPGSGSPRAARAWLLAETCRGTLHELSSCELTRSHCAVPIRVPVPRAIGSCCGPPHGERVVGSGLSQRRYEIGRLGLVTDERVMSP